MLAELLQRPVGFLRCKNFERLSVKNYNGKLSFQCEILGSCSGNYEQFGLPGCDAVWCCKNLQTFRTKLPFSG
jgi:hypothetical protein